ncbi:MAG TPA: hypothetical protein VGJ28_18990, partial [Micromonosporaceae bacterium]
ALTVGRIIGALLIGMSVTIFTAVEVAGIRPRRVVRGNADQAHVTSSMSAQPLRSTPEVGVHYATDGRQLDTVEIGEADGVLMLSFHGTPTGRLGAVHHGECSLG